MSSVENKFTLEKLIESNSKADSGFAFHAPGRPSMKYSDLLIHSQYVRDYLNKEGVGKEHRVAVVLPNGPEMATAFVTMAAMSVCAPLNPTYKEKEFEFYLTDLNVRVVIIQEGMDSPVRKVAEAMKVPIIEVVVTRETPAGKFELKGHTGFTPVQKESSQPDDVGLILHTSGTTARPKIVPLTQSNLCHSARNIRETLKLTDKDICLNVMPLFHIHGLMGAVLSSVSAGASVICTPGFDAQTFFNCVKEYNPTWYTAVPTIHQSVLASYPDFKHVVGDHKFRFVRSSSASLPSQVMVDLEGALRAPVVEAFGMTEAAHQMACNPLPPHKRKPKSVGRAAGPEVSVMDPDGNLVKPGGLGEVVIRGPNVTSGYENNPEANKTAFAYGWFHTGDQGYMDEEGYLFLTGRIKEMINRAGEKVSPLEVEEILLTNNAVAQAVSFAIPHPTLGEDVAAAVILKKGHKVTEDDLRKHLTGRLAEFKTPQCILIVDTIPKGPTGKLQRMKLAELFKDQLSQLTNKYEAPINELEKNITSVWEENLKVKSVGRKDNFFRLGGDSLRLTKTLFDLKKKYNLGLELKDLYAHQTIASLAEAIQSQKTGSGTTAAKPLKAVSRNREIPASSIQERFYFLFKLNPNNSGSNGTSLTEIRSHLDIDILQKSIAAVIKKHEIFRTCYKQVGEQVIQVIKPSSEVHIELKVTDLSSHSKLQQNQTLLETSHQISAAPFNLENEFPFRFQLFKLSNDHFVMLKVVHHVAEDATTADNFYREISEAYQKLTTNLAPDLTPPEIQYADYAVWEKENITNERIKNQIEYWQQKLLNAPELTHLPLDSSRKQLITNNVSTESVNFPIATWQKAKDLSKVEDTTASVLGMTVFLALLHRLSGDNDLCIASPINLRHLKGFPNIMGPLINNFVIRSQTSTGITFKTFLHDVMKSAQEAYINSDVSIEKIMNLAGAKRTLNHAPLYQVMFDVVQTEPEVGATKIPHFIKIGGHAGAQDLDLYGRLIEGEKSVQLQFTYNNDLFESHTIKKFLEAYIRIFEGVIKNPEAKVSKLQIIDQEEKSNILEKFAHRSDDKDLEVIFSKTLKIFRNGIDNKLNDIRIYILDGEGEVSPLGVYGHLYVGGLDKIASTPSISTDLIFNASNLVVGKTETLYKSGLRGRFLKNGTLDVETQSEMKSDTSLDKPSVFAAPTNDIEKTVAGIWEKILRVSPIGRDDDFFKVGGNSLYLIRILNQLVEKGYNLELPDLYTSPTVAKLAEVISTRLNSTGESTNGFMPKVEIPMVPREADMPCSYAQQKMWFLSQMEKGNGTYNMSYYFNIEGDLNVAALRRAIREVSARHEIFRTTFVKKKSLPRQVTLKDHFLDLSISDLTTLSADKLKEEKKKLLELFQKTTFDISVQPPVAAKLIKLAPKHFIFCLIVDHILFDGWSGSLLLTETQALYEAYCKSLESPLPPPRSQYIDYAVWHNNLLEGPERTRQIDFWKETLSGHDLVLNLPTVRPRPPVRMQDGNTILFPLTPEVQRGLKQFCQTQSVTPFITLMSVYKLLLHSYSKQDKFLIGLPVANRSTSQIETIMGLFASTLTSPVDLSSNPGFSDFLKKELQLFLATNKNQDLPFEMVVEAMKPKRSLSHTPLFQVLFNFVNSTLKRELELRDLKVTTLTEDRPSKNKAKYDLNLLFIEGPTGEIRGELEYSTDIYDESTAHNIIADYLSLLTKVIENPNGKINSFSYSLSVTNTKPAA